jgi:early secretory antigenic target protein ESAT-6
MSDLSFHIDPALCMQAHGEIEAAAKRMRSLLDEVEADGKILVAGWEGDARDAYLARQAQWNQDASTILDKLNRINAALERSVQTYVDADRRGVNLITGG